MKKKCEILGKLLKSADDLQLFYYENKNMMSNCPEVLAGSNFIELVSRSPRQGIEGIKRKAFPFKRSAMNLIKKNPEKEIQAKMVVKVFNVALNEAESICSQTENKKLTDEEKNNMFFNYLKY